MNDSKPRRLNWGSGPEGAPGWLNADIVSGARVELQGDIRDGLPLDDASMDYIFSSHALQQLTYFDVPGALRELHRVLRPGGVLRLGLPDLDRAIDALQRGDASYFYVPDADARSVSGKFIVQMTWYGSSPMLFNYDYVRELLHDAGFRHIHRCDFRQTKSPFPGIVELDNRERESFFVEAVK